MGVALFANGTTVNVNIESNTFEVPSTAPTSFVGLFALGTGVSGTVGGAGSLGNVFNGYADHVSIYRTNTGGAQNQNLGYPNLTISTNTYERGGVTLTASQAVQPIS